VQKRANGLSGQFVHQLQEQWVFTDGSKQFNIQVRKLGLHASDLAGNVFVEVVAASHEQWQDPEVSHAILRELLRNLLQGWHSVLHKTEEHFFFTDILFQVAGQLFKWFHPIGVLAAVRQKH